MENQLKKAIDIAKRTGDRLIVYDSSKSHPPYVILSLDEYEKIIFGKSDVRGLTEDELLDKINRDIAIWKSDQYGNTETDMTPDFRPKEMVAESLDRDYSPRAFDMDYEDDDVYFEEEETMAPPTPQRGSPRYDSGQAGQASFPRSISGQASQLSSRRAGQAKKMGNLWRIPSDRKEGAEEVIEEDRQYLENIDL